MFFIGKQLKQAKQLLRQGELNQACRVARQVDFAGSSMGRRIANDLIDRLVERAGRFSSDGDLNSAWNDLTDASSIAISKNADRVSRETTRLVDRTIDIAQAQLQAGKPGSASSTISLLTRRRIPDRRANEMQEVCEMISTADQLAARGKLNDATSLLSKTRQLRPDLTFLDTRIRNFDSKKTRLSDLTHQLRFAMNHSAWSGAKEVTNRILRIAPDYQVAKDAARRCDTKQANAIKSIHWLNGDGEGEDGEGEGDASLQDTGVAFADTNASTSEQTGNKQTGNNEAGNNEAVNNQPALANQPKGTRGTRSRNSIRDSQPVMIPGDDAINDASGIEPGEPMRSFMLWIDGVGGFLVCTGETVTIGRAVPNSGIDIPVQADLRRHHLKIKRVENQYLAKNLAENTPASSEPEWQMLRDQQDVDLGNGVSLKFSQTHPLGRSARMHFTSRHRTEPWSDAVLLMGDAILLGPDRSFHVCCPQWKSQLVIFRKGDQIVVRSNQPAGTDEPEIEVDGSTAAGDIVLKDGMLLTGPEFSISCEQVKTTG